MVKKQECSCRAIKAGAIVANVVTRWVDVDDVDECFVSLLSDLKKAEATLRDIDSSCDRTDMQQLSVFCLLPLSGHTTGEILFNELTQLFEKHSLDISKIVSVVTDGAPSMVGANKGLVSRLATVNPGLLAFQCIIHKSVWNCAEKWKMQWLLWLEWLILFL